MAKREIRIGTAGWSIHSRYAERFPGPGSHLERYARQMACAEINTSFYRPHQRKTYEKWREATPKGFRFSVKLPRALTHDQRLADPLPLLRPFADEVAGLGDKLAVVLAQLPPSLRFDADLADRFFAALADALPCQVACEPRHVSWMAPEAERLLADRRVARVAADPPRAETDAAPGGWRGLAYVRLHGSPVIYRSAYDAAALDRVAAVVSAAKTPAWIIFDNTAASAALGDALALRERLGA